MRDSFFPQFDSVTALSPIHVDGFARHLCPFSSLSSPAIDFFTFDLDSSFDIQRLIAPNPRSVSDCCRPDAMGRSHVCP
jgi:hypothetical protein